MKRTPIIWILLLGLCLRFMYIILSEHVYHPDEIFQSVEQTNRIITGVGIIPWDIQYRLRSAIPIFITLPPAYILEKVGIPTIRTSQLIYIFGSLAVIIASYLSTHKTHPRLAVSVAFVIATWYELIYISSRALSENVSLLMLAISAAFYLVDHPRSSSANSISIILASLTILIRPQYVLFALMLIFINHRQIHSAKQTMIAVIIALLIGLLIDTVYYQSLTLAQVHNIYLSFLQGISAQFGISPWWYYLYALILTTGGIILFSFKAPKNIVWYVTMITLAIHSLVPHKEYRFIIITIPILIAASIIGLSTLFKPKLVVGIFLLLSILGTSRIFPDIDKVYAFSFFHKDPLFDQYARLPACDVYLTNRSWVWSGGYTYYDQPFELFSQGYPPPSQKPVIQLTDTYSPHAPVQTILPSTPCRSAPDPATLDIYRSFDSVENILYQTYE